MKHFVESQEIQMWIGPHIKQRSFQVDLKITKDILSKNDLSFKQALSKNWIQPSFEQTQHYFIDLQSILCHKALKMGVEQIYASPINTMTSATHYSHRRNRHRIGTNYSFIFSC